MYFRSLREKSSDGHHACAGGAEVLRTEGGIGGVVQDADGEEMLDCKNLRIYFLSVHTVFFIFDFNLTLFVSFRLSSI